MKRDLYAEVSARILAELEAGAVPWVKPWAATAGQNVPQNAVTNRPYSGSNVILLWLARARGWQTPRFLTFKQALEAGGNVRKGEHGTKIFFVKQLQVKEVDGEETDIRLVPMLREYTVFNVSQCENLPENVRTGKPMRVRNPDTRDALADEFLSSTGADIREGNGEAYYVPSRDFISMPAFEAFKGADHFYGIALHELTHWSGRRSRLDRDLKNRFGSLQYAAEELVAELGAAFLCTEFGFDGDVRHAGYIASWIELLKADSPHWPWVHLRLGATQRTTRQRRIRKAGPDCPVPMIKRIVVRHDEASDFLLFSPIYHPVQSHWVSRSSGRAAAPV
jgi:antirestriction protein ArdC